MAIFMYLPPEKRRLFLLLLSTKSFYSRYFLKALRIFRGAGAVVKVVQILLEHETN